MNGTTTTAVAIRPRANGREPSTRRSSSHPRDWLDPILHLLRCPVTHNPLRKAEADEILAAQRIVRRRATPQNGSFRETTFQAGLVSSDSRLCYPIVDGILVLLPHLAIEIATCHAPASANRPAAELRAEKQAAMEFYDRVGWQKGPGGEFTDALEYEDLRNVSKAYRTHCHRRVGQHLNPTGEFLLDVASGPIQYAEYFAYSEGYRYHVCVDLSMVALRAARAKLGPRGICILGDITNLPLRRDAVDAVVSLHTLYHVPHDEQETAFRELHRVLRPGGTAVAVYSWGEHSLLMKIALLRFGFLRAAKQRLRWYAMRLRHALWAKSGAVANSNQASDPALYFHAHEPKWWLSRAWGFPLELRCWRSVRVEFLKRFVHRFALGCWLLHCVARIEDRWPRWAGRYGQYPMFIIRKVRPKLPCLSRVRLSERCVERLR